MRPLFARNDLGDLSGMNPKLSSDALLEHPFFIQLSNVLNLFTRQFVKSCPFSPSRIVPTLQHHIRNILSIRACKQVVRPDAWRVVTTMKDMAVGNSAVGDGEGDTVGTESVVLPASP